MATIANGVSNGVANANNAAPDTQQAGISADEIALYDRQIRLWGVQAQERLRLADVLLIGMKGLGNEIAKNLILAGINSLDIVDDDFVTEDDLSSQFLVSAEDIGKIRSTACLPAARALNPRVRVSPLALATLLTAPENIGRYTIVIATDQTLPFYTRINISCRMQSRPFYAASTLGLYGFIFADLIKHTYSITREKSNITTILGAESATRTILSSSTAPRNSEGKQLETVLKSETYCPINLANTSPLPAFHLSTSRRKFAVTPILACIRALWDYQARTATLWPTHNATEHAHFATLAHEKHQELQLPPETLRADTIQSFLLNLGGGAEISPVCAFLGGQVAQDVINVLGKREQPLQNFVVFDGEDTKALTYCLWTDMPAVMQEVVEQAKGGMVGVVAAASSAGAGGVGAGGGMMGTAPQVGMRASGRTGMVIPI